MSYLLDSNIVIALLAGQGSVVERVEKSAMSILLSAIVMHELLFGAYGSNRVAENLDRLDDLRFPVLPFELDDARAAGEIRAALRKTGTPIGPYDVLIAGQALARDLVLVTANTREFARVAGLKLEDWTRD